MLDEKPQLVHFCGYGEGEAGIVLENEKGESKLVSTEALGYTNATGVLESLSAALKDSDADVRRSAASALGSLGDAGRCRP